MKESKLNKVIRCAILNAVSCTFLFYSPISSATRENQSQQAVEKTESFEVIKKAINKSPNDQAIYQAIRLNNGMEVLLISDEKANKSLMSVAIGIGSMEDPLSQQGLAHYLEHMILMGSKLYPSTNSLDAFLNKNGGYNNAYTSDDRTSYFLEVNNNAFDEAVLRLADTFTEPLLSEENAKKEINAVNAEMVRAKSNDSYLLHAINLATANPAHPFTNFTVGNKETLSDKPDSKLQTELVNFYQKYYSANLTKAVLYSNQSIEKLTALAIKSLGKMPNKNVVLSKINDPVFRREDKSVVISYKPIKPNKLLTISFDFPEDKNEFKYKTGEYLTYIFNNNTEGTLSDYLIKQGLSDNGVSAESTSYLARSLSDFSIYVNLTDKGLTQKDKVISLIFQQIEKIKQEGIQESYFKELKESLNQSFQHLQVEKDGDYIQFLASQMLDYPIEHILDQPYLAEKLDMQAVKNKLNSMTLDNARIILVYPQVETDKKTKYFQAPYSIKSITDKQRRDWSDNSKNVNLNLPALNPYFATDFSLNVTNKDRKSPIKISQGNADLIYAMESQYFADEPKVNLSANYSIPTINDEKKLLSFSLLNYIYELVESKLAFQANVAGIDHHLFASYLGLSLSADGYSQHLSKLLYDSLNLFSQFKLNDEILLQAKQRYLEMLNKQEKEGSLNQVNDVIDNFRNYPYFNRDKERKIIKAITLEDIEKARKILLNNVTGLNLISLGNFSDTQVLTLVQQLGKVIKNNQQKINRGQYLDINNSSRKLNAIKKVQNEDNALNMTFMSSGYDEMAGYVRARLLRDIISRWYFDDLRTEKQLGYVVYATNTLIGKTSGMQFLVQSPNTSPKGIFQHNQRFFKEAQDKLTSMSEEEFKKYQESLIEKMRYKPESLSQEMNRLHFDFIRGNEKFDHISQVIQAVEKLTKKDLLDFYQQTVIDQKGLVFISQALGTKTDPNDMVDLTGFEKVDNIEELQKSFPIGNF